MSCCEHTAATPALDEYDPAGHNVHEAEAPAELKYDPTGHNAHAEAPVEP